MLNVPWFSTREAKRLAKLNQVTPSASGGFDVAVSGLEKLAEQMGVIVGMEFSGYRVTGLAIEAGSSEPMVIYTDGEVTWVRPLMQWAEAMQFAVPQPSQG